MSTNYTVKTDRSNPEWRKMAKNKQTRENKIISIVDQHHTKYRNQLQPKTAS